MRLNIYISSSLIKHSFILVILLLTFNSNSFGQEEPTKLTEEQIEYLIKDRLEYLIEVFEDEDLDISVIMDELRYLYDHPINLNKANREQLRDLFLLNEFQINALFNYLKEYGKLNSINELQIIPEFDFQSIQRISPFVVVKEKSEVSGVSFSELLSDGKHEVYLRYIRELNEKEGYSAIEDSLLEENPNRRYLGSPDHLYTRYAYRYKNNLRWGFTAEKDAGEKFFGETQPYGFDYWSFHLYLSNIGKIKAIALGDYHVQFGQGLTFWTGFNFGKTAFVMNSKRTRQGVRPYTSLDENRFLRGGAVNLAFGKFEFTTFVSYRGVDANVSSSAGDTLANEAERIVTSLQTTGLHRTPRELDGKNAIKEFITGGNIQYNSKNLQIGITGVYHEFEGSFQRNLRTYNQFDFNRNELANLGADYRWTFGNVNLYGEAAVSDNGGYATTHGASIFLDPRLSISLLYRNFSNNYQSIYTASFAEGSRTVNEEGFYAAMEFRIAPSVTFTGYYDRFRYNWLRFQTDGLANGNDFLGQLTFKPNRDLEIYVRYRNRDRPRNQRQDDGNIREVLDANQQIMRLHVRYKVSPSITLRARVEQVIYQFENQNDKGYVLYQDFVYNPSNLPISFNLRYALFETESFDARIYAYENDMLYVFAVPMYNGRGSRFYFNFRWTIRKGIDLWMKYGYWLYNDRDVIGTGLETIDGNQRNQFRMQLRFRF